MAGIYVHIPFCRKNCYYCDFHFSVSHKHKPELVNAIISEIEQRKNYLSNNTIESIYFGGGTPSVLDDSELGAILQVIHKNFTVSADAEFTFEANPDDLTKSYLKMLHAYNINRLSIGIQSFQPNILQMMNRSHTVEQALGAVHAALDEGFNNISIDLIYGIPGMTLMEWENNLKKALELGLPHLSCYHLGIEPNTVFYVKQKRGLFKEVLEEESAQQFNLLRQLMLDSEYEQYEISNFAKGKRYSQHNLLYWSGKQYLGVGPSSHSFNGISRQWDIRVNSEYIKRVGEGGGYFEMEIIDVQTHYNEWIMTSLRTMWGLDTNHLHNFGFEFQQYFNQASSTYIKQGILLQKNNELIISPEFLLISDKIISDLMMV